VLPLRDNAPTRRFPIVTVAIIVANFAVWIFWEKAGTGAGFTSSLTDGGYFPCEVVNDCRAPGGSWWTDAFTSMFMHSVFYILGGLAATASQTFVTLAFGSDQAARVPNIGASGAIAAVLGAYLVLLPRARVFTYVLPFFFFEIPAVFFLGFWFLFQLFVGSQSLVQPEQGGGIAFFAHIGGFLFGLLAVWVFTAGRQKPLRPAY